MSSGGDGCGAAVKKEEENAKGSILCQEEMVDLNCDKMEGTEEMNLFHTEFIRLRQILPEEVWKLIADKLGQEGSQNNIENLSNSSPFFQNLLASQRTTNLFEKVFELVTSKVWKREGIQGFPISEILKCRAVCYRWNKAIDKLIQEQFQEFETFPSDKKSSRIREAFGSITRNNNWFDNYLEQLRANLRNRFPRPNVIIKPIKTVRDFLTHFESTHHPPGGNQANLGRSPLIWGNLSVNLRQNLEDQAYQLHLQDISQVFFKYGSYITKFSFNFPGNLYESLSFWQPWFSNMPNLKELDICGINIFRTPNNYLINQVDFEVPPFKKLVTLNATKIPNKLFNKLITSESSQISELNISGLEGPKSYDFLRLALRNLKTFQMDYNSVEIFEIFLGSSQFLRWPVEQLVIKFNKDDEITDTAARGGCGTAVVFKMIEENFSGTLESLHFETEVMDTEVDGPVYEDCKNCRLNLPNLKDVSLFFSGSLVCLDFLLGMKNSLEEISICFGYSSGVMRRYKEKVRRECIVEFVGFEMEILESNIWELFNKLGKVRVTRMKMVGGEEVFEGRILRCYTREEWIEKNKRLIKNY